MHEAIIMHKGIPDATSPCVGDTPLGDGGAAWWAKRWPATFRLTSDQRQE